MAKWCWFALGVWLFAHGGPARAEAVSVKDMAGRTVAVPERISKVWPAYPPLTYLVYAIDPTLLSGWNHPLSADTRRFVPPAARDLPVVGGWFGQRTPNIEALLLARPDVALVWDDTLQSTPGLPEQMRRFAIPVVAVKHQRIVDYPETLAFLGRLLGREARTRELTDLFESYLRKVRASSAAIPASSRRSVYYAIGPTGLGIDCNHMPFLEEAITLAGGNSVHECHSGEQVGATLSMEVVFQYDPDVIITQDDTFVRRIDTDPRWKQLRAVREHRVFRIPSLPFNWLNYPPSFMRVIGVEWLATKLYPGRLQSELRPDVIRFFRQVLHVELTPRDLDTILDG
jgi:iron complex transport system substrate-binding protein